MILLSIVGARPQFIKVAALQREIAKNAGINHLILHTAQHYDYNMSAIFFEELEIPTPDYLLAADEPGSSASIGRMTAGIEEILTAEQPDIVIVYGDTNTTLSGALAAKKSHLKLAHVEAGLRSYDNAMPEETNRIQTDTLSDLLFCPTAGAKNNLLKEGFNHTQYTIIVSGDIMLDAMNYYAQKVNAIDDRKDIIPGHEFILCTLHRQSLVQSHYKLTEVVYALNQINRHTPVMMPAHPRFKKVVKNFGLKIDFVITEPVGYLDMIRLLESCSAVITDSGGLQKEAFFCGKPCITVRNETEWTELVLAGVNFIAGDSSATVILNAFYKAINTKKSFDGKFYGDGNSAKIIVDSIVSYLQNS